MIYDCPDGECDGITRLQDDNVYSDDVEYEVMEEIKEPKKKTNPKQFDGVKSDKPFTKTRKKK